MCPDKPHAFPSRGPRPEHGAACLFPPLADEAARQLEGYGEIVAQVLDLKPKHRRELPANIRQLSHELTDERAMGFAPKYMSDAASLSAYVSFFLPWNLYRLTRLLSGLELELPERAVCVDLGSGPLTVVQALWLARPELRGRELRFYCLDRAAKPMRVGQELFARLAGPDTPWRLELIQGGLGTRLPARADLLTAANVLNELGTRAGEGREERMALGLSRQAAKDARLLLVEPGTRTGGRLLSALRSELAEEGFAPLAPCTHAAECPMPGTTGKPWCHFQFGTAGSPRWLERLSEQAGFHRRGVALSFLYAARGEAARTPAGVRVISDIFELPGTGRSGRYGCAEAGLVLAAGGEQYLRGLPSGCLWRPRWPDAPERDLKSGALMISAGPVRGAGASEGGPMRRGASEDRPARGNKQTSGMLKVRDMALQAFRAAETEERSNMTERKGRARGRADEVPEERTGGRAKGQADEGGGASARSGRTKAHEAEAGQPKSGEPRQGKERYARGQGKRFGEPGGERQGSAGPKGGKPAGRPKARAKAHGKAAQAPGKATPGREGPARGKAGAPFADQAAPHDKSRGKKFKPASDRSGDQGRESRQGRAGRGQDRFARDEHEQRGVRAGKGGKPGFKARSDKPGQGRAEAFSGPDRADRGGRKPGKPGKPAQGGRADRFGDFSPRQGQAPKGRKGAQAGADRSGEFGARPGGPRHFKGRGKGPARGHDVSAYAAGVRQLYDSRATREQLEYERQMREGQERGRRESGENDDRREQGGREERGQRGRGRGRGPGGSKGGGNR